MSPDVTIDAAADDVSPPCRLGFLFSGRCAAFLVACLLRLGLLLYGAWQDSHSVVKYTDIDYAVFTDAAGFVARGHPAGPYARATYRYTPLLAWLLLPTTRLALFGKLFFAAADLLAGWLLLWRLRLVLPAPAASAFAIVWLWNPMVAAISTRGSSESLLAVLTMALLWAVEARRVGLAGAILGLGVHFKIYPFIYAPAIVLWMDAERMGRVSATRAIPPLPPSSSPSTAVRASIARFCSADRIRFSVVSLVMFLGLNYLMYFIYGLPFLQHTFFHHVTRIDHRHNFSPYNVLLYLASASAPTSSSLLRIESLAFAPQLLLSCVLIPLVLAKRDLANCMLAQTFAFVTFNKVCTSQYFVWYLVFLPLYLPRSSFLQRPVLGVSALILWIAGQAVWLHQAFKLEFLGISTFYPGLWLTSLAILLANCWILVIIVNDGAARQDEAVPKAHLE